LIARANPVAAQRCKRGAVFHIGGLAQYADS
jgi:hypothetical protein